MFPNDVVPILNISFLIVAVACCIASASTMRRRPVVGQSMLLCGGCFFLICAVLAFTYRFPKRDSTVQDVFPTLFQQSIEDTNAYLDKSDLKSVTLTNPYVSALVTFVNRKWSSTSVGPAIGGTALGYTSNESSTTWTRPSMQTTLDILKNPGQHYTAIYDMQITDASRCLWTMCCRLFYIVADSILNNKPLNEEQLCTAMSFIGYSNDGHPWFPLKDIKSYAITKNANWIWSRAQPLMFWNDNLKVYTFGSVEDVLDVLNGNDTVSPFSKQFDRSFPDQLKQFVYREGKANSDWTFQSPEVLSRTGIIANDSSSNSMDGVELLKNQFSNNFFTNQTFANVNLGVGVFAVAVALSLLIR